MEICRWPGLGRRLFSVQTLWIYRKMDRCLFRSSAEEIFWLLYPWGEYVHGSVFRLSDGLFGLFLQQHKIGIRCIAGAAREVPRGCRVLVMN